MVAYPYSSRIPDAIDALVAAFTAAFAGSDSWPQGRVFVRDGPWLAAESGGAYAQDMAVGWSGFYPGYQYPTRSLSEELGEATATATNLEGGLAPGQEETFSIDCASLVQTGADPSSAEWSLLRHLAYGNIAAAAAFVSDPLNDGYLAGTVEKLVFARTNSLHQVPQRRGVLVIAAFTLECVSQTQR